ncbi:hypothetical protein ACJVC5_10610 [Peredibacter sp. HCB2-198]|uniref:hypothetical protein n=1 Tax=Peredibacter sp. HCB2-198 TaxID=3383025 RepID=UPI0038B683F1
MKKVSAMQVLIENPQATIKNKPKSLLPSFWSSSMFYMGPTFSMTSLFDLSDPLGLSPFVSVDAKIAFMVALLDKGGAVLARNMGALGVVAIQFSAETVTQNEDPKKITNYYQEYFSSEVNNPDLASYDQIIVFGVSNVIPELWKKLKPGGHYIFGTEGSLEYPNPKTFEAIGTLWPEGEATEFGWKFNSEELGLVNFEVAKIKKL